MITFPPTFHWGAATAAYQVEGAVAEDGRGPSIWDRFCEEPGRIADGSSGAVACDHYHRYRQDVGLMSEIGLNTYRFSIAWPRILPEGTGRVEPRGLDFYDRLVDELLAHGITPWPTLYHWDMPAALHERGHGWAHRASTEAFAEYTQVVARRLGDRVKHWFTHNEPMCAAYLGYVEGQQAPGIRGDWPSALRVVHHLLLSHGMAVRVLRDTVADAQVGIVLNPVPTYPASPSDADARAARHVDGRLNRWFLDPLYGRGYPDDMVAWHTEQGHLPEGLAFVQDGDLDVIATPTDLLGVNYYSRAIARSDEIAEEDNLPPTIVRGDDETEMGWEVVPEALTDLLVRLHADYDPGALVVAENGAAWATGPDADGRVRDVRRLRYVRDHLVACHRAIEQGVPLRGYLLWSLMDNFEWAFGYERRFGIVWIDYETQARTLKDSGRWYASVIARGGLDPREEGI